MYLRTLGDDRANVIKWLEDGAFLAWYQFLINRKFIFVAWPIRLIGDGDLPKSRCSNTEIIFANFSDEIFSLDEEKNRSFFCRDILIAPLL